MFFNSHGNHIVYLVASSSFYISKIKKNVKINLFKIYSYTVLFTLVYSHIRGLVCGISVSRYTVEIRTQICIDLFFPSAMRVLKFKLNLSRLVAIALILRAVFVNEF